MLGLLKSFFGIGMIVGSTYLIKKLNKKLGSHKTLVLSIVLVALGILLSALDNFYAFCAALIMMGIGVVMFNINSTHVRCTATPKIMRSSFEFIFLACCIVFIPVGVFLVTWVLNGGYLGYFYVLIFLALLALSFIILKNRDIAHVYQVNDDKLDGFYGSFYPSVYK